MSSTVEILDGDALRERRQSILTRIGVSEDELRERGERYALTADELAALDELDGLDYLRDGLSSQA